MRYLRRDSHSSDIAFDDEKAKLDSIAKEHSDAYIEGTQDLFLRLLLELSSPRCLSRMMTLHLVASPLLIVKSPLNASLSADHVSSCQ